jgi:NADPH:quinone reductase-like Zn-dependent oxidoreductase
MAKAFGAEVTAVCSTRNLELVRAIGADHAVDYTRQDFTQGDPGYDLIFDAMGNRSALDLRRALAPQGRCVIAGFTNLPRLFEHLVARPLLSRAGGKQIGMMGIAVPRQADLVTIQGMLASGQIVSVIEDCYPLSETAAAIRHLETLHARGKLIIRVAAAEAGQATDLGRAALRVAVRAG